MTDTVYTLQENVKHEGTTLLGVYSTEEKAVNELDKEVGSSRFDESRRWSSDSMGHIVSVRLLDVTLVVEEWEVQ